jgi:hypothetical protein
MILAFAEALENSVFVPRGDARRHHSEVSSGGFTAKCYLCEPSGHQRRPGHRWGRCLFSGRICSTALPALEFGTLFLESKPFHVLFGTFMWLLIQDCSDPLTFGSDRDLVESKGVGAASEEA